MATVKYVYWQDHGVWLGYLEEYPDYMTEGATQAELLANLHDIYDDLTSGAIPGVRKVGEMVLA